MIKVQDWLCFLVVTIVYLSHLVYSDHSDAVSSTCTKNPKLNYLSDYTNVYKNIRMCFRVAYSKGITDSDGRIYVSYRAKLNKGEDPNALCNCIKKFILQGDWYKGAKDLCYVECNTVTLLLIGTPDKRFINAKPVYKGKEPIDGIIDVFEIYSNAQVWSDKCIAKTGVNKAGYKNVMWTCDYCGPNLPSKDELCAYIYAYVNGGEGNDILGNTCTHKCTVKNDKFYLELVAKKK